MPRHRDHHATIFVPPDVAGPIEAVRRTWDGVMAMQIPAHVTLAYPREAPRPDLLVERLREACATQSPFRLRLGQAGCSGRPEDGVYVRVEDVDRGFERLRRAILCPPFAAIDVAAHVTLVHPRTSSRGHECWEDVCHRRFDLEFTATQVAITAFDGTRWDALETFPLGVRP